MESCSGRDTLHGELVRYAHLFDTIERSPLTREQRIAAVTMADRNLLIAAAGSGKTSSMVGKVAYALCSEMCSANQILVLAFNRKAAQELDDRLRRALASYLPAGTGVMARTLHALGLDIVTQVKGSCPQIQNDGNGLLSRVLAKLVHDDVDFAEHWLLFRVFYHVPVRHPDEFATRKQWKAFVQQHGTVQNRRHGFITLGGEQVPTQFEQAVANWLTLFGIDYVYTKLKGGSYWKSWLAGRLFRPLSGQTGFLLADLNRYIVCVSGAPEVTRVRADKRARIRADRKAGITGKEGCSSTPVIYLNIDTFHDATVFMLLRKQLDPGGMRLKPVRIKTVLARLGHRLTPGQTEFLTRFIRIARLDGIRSERLLARAPDSPDPVRTSMHAPMLAKLVCAYSDALDDANTIDFEGMLHRASNYLDQARYTHAYTLILVDEFQDTSQAGLRLLKSLLAQNSQCKLFAVGDDWQSIYRFAGAVPDVLSRFEHHFGPSVVNHLTATFRFDQSIADVASRFVQANPEQLRKHVRARANSSQPSIVLKRYATPAHMLALCEACLHDSTGIPIEHTRDQQNASGRVVSVYILGRYRHQRPPGLPRWNTSFPQLDIQYQTVHSAKGLEADVVIVLGLGTGRYGFPAQVRDDPLISLVMPVVEDFPDAEERRLFYVAMTRARHRVYLLADTHQPSPFVTELITLMQAESESKSSTLC